MASQPNIRLGIIRLGIISLVGLVVVQGRAVMGQEQSLTSVMLHSGRQVSAAWRGWDDRQQFRFRVDEREVAYPSEDVFRWGEFPTAGRASQLILRDGSRLVGELVEVHDATLGWSSRELGDRSLVVRREWVKAIVFGQQLTPSQYDRIDSRLNQQSPVSSDVLWTVGRSEISGRMLVSANAEAEDWLPLESIRFAPTGVEDAVDVRCESLTVALLAEPSSSEASSSGPLDPAKPGGPCWFALRDGSRLHAREATVVDNLLKLRLVSGLRLHIEAPQERVVGYRHDRDVIYLSDLPDGQYQHTPLFSQAWGFQRDQVVTGGALRWQQADCLKGIGMHSRSRLAFNLNGQYRKFRAHVGLDGRAGRLGGVNFRVYVQGQDGGFEQRYDSGVLLSGDAPVPLEVDLVGQSMLILIVDHGPRGDTQDHANWFLARLIR